MLSWPGQQDQVLLCCALHIVRATFECRCGRIRAQQTTGKISRCVLCHVSLTAACVMSDCGVKRHCPHSKSNHTYIWAETHIYALCYSIELHCSLKLFHCHGAYQAPVNVHPMHNSVVFMARGHSRLYMCA
jgi:hypothetical protein